MHTPRYARPLLAVAAGVAIASAASVGGIAAASTAETVYVPGTGCDLMQAEHAMHVENPDVWSRISADPATKDRFDSYATSDKATREATASSWGADADAVTHAIESCAQH